MFLQLKFAYCAKKQLLSTKTSDRRHISQNTNDAFLQEPVTKFNTLIQVVMFIAAYSKSYSKQNPIRSIRRHENRQKARCTEHRDF